eukprot:m.94392 g.94392  ORF g.94392 m.94392 type:complete len:320 (-) comp12239_c0_seq5:287-1246(-)
MPARRNGCLVPHSDTPTPVPTSPRPSPRSSPKTSMKEPRESVAVPFHRNSNYEHGESPYESIQPVQPRELPPDPKLHRHSDYKDPGPEKPRPNKPGLTILPTHDYEDLTGEAPPIPPRSPKARHKRANDAAPRLDSFGYESSHQLTREGSAAEDPYSFPRHVGDDGYDRASASKVESDYASVVTLMVGGTQVERDDGYAEASAPKVTRSTSAPAQPPAPVQTRQLYTKVSPKCERKSPALGPRSGNSSPQPARLSAPGGGRSPVLGIRCAHKNAETNLRCKMQPAMGQAFCPPHQCPKCPNSKPSKSLLCERCIAQGLA